FCACRSCARRYLHSFPTRRSSDLVNAVEITVRGIFTSVTKAYDDSALRVPIGLARQLLRVQGAQAWVIVLDRTEDTDPTVAALRSEEHTSELQSPCNLVCRLLLEK